MFYTIESKWEKSIYRNYTYVGELLWELFKMHTPMPQPKSTTVHMYWQSALLVSFSSYSYTNVLKI